MDKSTLKGIETFLKIEGDCTVRLLNRNVPTPKKYIFATLLFDGNIGLWAAVLLTKTWSMYSKKAIKNFQRRSRNYSKK